MSEKDRAFAQTLDNVELYLTFFFLIDYMIHLYASENRMKHVTQPLVVVDLITIVPSLAIVCIQIASEPGSNDGERPSELDTASKLNFLRFIRVLKVLRVLRLLQTFARNSPQDQSSEITSQVAKMVLTGVSLIFCFAGLFQIIETNFNTMDSLLETWGKTSFHFHDALYFTIITISTVGYGDYYPTTIVGKFSTCFMILGSLASITDSVNKLVDLMSIHSPYARASYKAGKGHQHCIVCGAITPATLHDFFQEFFHEDHGDQNETMVVIMGNDVPCRGLLEIINDPRYSTRTRFLEGSVLVDADLNRADITRSVCTFIMCDKAQTERSFEEDKTNIMRAINIKKFVNAVTAGGEAKLVISCLRVRTGIVVFALWRGS